MNDDDNQELQRYTPGAAQMVPGTQSTSAIGKTTLTADLAGDDAELDAPRSDELTARAATTPTTESPLFEAPQWDVIERAEMETGAGDAVERPSQERGSQLAGSERPPQRARAMKGTAHRRFDLSMSTQVDERGVAGWGVVDRVRNRTAAAMRVDVKAPQTSPIVVPPGGVPNEAELFQRAEEGKHRVTHQRGTLEKPNTHNVMDQERLYIGGKPDAADIRQGGIGDCYLQACLLSIVANDPGQIMKMISLEGNQARITFWRFDDLGAHPVHIQTSDTLLTTRNEDGSRRLVGAHVRRAAAPLRTSWWARVVASTLELHRHNAWEIALWAALIEKAYAHYAELYGQFGTKPTAKDRKLGGGYDIINQGGWTEECFRVIYGPAAMPSEVHDMTFAAEDDLVLRNKETLKKLVTYESTRMHTSPGQTQGFLEAHVGAIEAVERCRAYSRVIRLQLSTEQRVDALMGSLLPGRALRAADRDELRANLTMLEDAIDEYRDDDPAAREALATVAATLLTPNLFPAIWDDSRAACYRHLRESLGVLTDLGSVNLGQRSIIADHAYNVKSVQLRDRKGAALALTTDDVARRLRDIDPTRSAVVIENPHAENEPDLRGDGPADKRPDGRFTFTLEQFLRTFDKLGISAVMH